MASTTRRGATDDKLFKLYSHEEAEKCGFVSKLCPEHNGIHLSTPNYPGVALYATNPLYPENKAVGALVQIIPADNAVVYSEITAVQEKEVTVNMICTTKDTPTPVRFLLGNFFSDDTLFTITDGKNNLVDLIVKGRSYTKLPGTTEGKEVLLSDTGLKTSSEGDRKKRPTSGTSYKIAFKRLTKDARAFLSTFDNNDVVPLMTLKTPPLFSPPPVWPFPAYKQQTEINQQQRLYPAINGGYGKNREMTAKLGEEVPDCAGCSLQRDCAGSGAGFAGEISSCASIVNNTSVDSMEYDRRYFKPMASYSVDVYFGKSLYIPPEPVVPSTKSLYTPPEPVAPSTLFVPKLILCRGGKAFICPHGAHNLCGGPVNIVERMNCECVADDSRKFACAKMLTNMLD